MLLLRNLRISFKIYMAFAVLLGLMVTLGVLAVNRFFLLADESTEISGSILPKLDHLTKMDAMRYALRARAQRGGGSRTCRRTGARIRGRRD